ncbi:hypothetical protein JQS43_24590 [Natronosporangium hydrolyticum]|uniref:D-apionate lactonase C-terminal domain-containing protein n=1 Tax=Natronosporangium hydrolyticum TaxID=2811111 RepID=A0A895YGI1_9ACTN|nr:hypothetical protein [Natronosporangium hydrolyticum]QSB14609.1 hypothetical protein JQS43_24590 [Natronosporangium hydrolyticum]
MTRPVIPVQTDWSDVIRSSRTTLTTHMWNAPPLQPGAPTRGPAFQALRELKANCARFLTFWTHPQLAVPALTPPTETSTSWDFSRIDPFVADFMAAAEGRPVVAHHATIPHWMFDVPDSFELDPDPGATVWDYEVGKQPRDPSLREIADYFERFARWYISGGFTDERGVHHASDHRYRFAHWEVLIEPDIGHQLSPEVYTRLYDLVVERLRPLDPEMRFVGLSLSPVTQDADYFWHFLNPANHQPGIPIDAFSHHFYASPALINPLGSEGNAPFHTWPTTFFAQADGFLDKVALVDSIRRHLSPNTEHHINEIGSFAPDVLAAEPQIPQEYWALGGALIGYLWSRLTTMGIELVGVAEFLGYPGVIPGTTLVDWDTGEPNARYQVLRLLLDHFGPGDQVVTTSAGSELAPEPPVHAQGFLTNSGERRLLLVNRSAEPAEVDLATVGTPVTVSSVSVDTAAGPPVTAQVHEPALVLAPFATAVVTFT